MTAPSFDKARRVYDRCHMRFRRSASAPLPLLAGFALFLAGLVWLVAASLTRREAPVFTLSAPMRARAPSWMERGDTLTLDATDGEQWRYASLTQGRALGDSAGWEIAVRRHNITVAGALADLGAVQFERARVPAATIFVSSAARESANDAIKRWYSYSFVTHLLRTQGHVYALRTRDGRMWKLQVLGYYCPGLTAGCLTIRYAPIRSTHDQRSQQTRKTPCRTTSTSRCNAMRYRGRAGLICSLPRAIFHSSQTRRASLH
jgi:hypothetical protein